MEVVREDGVKDLPLHVRGPFAHALIEERNGNTDEAQSYLDKAVYAEQNGHKAA